MRPITLFASFFLLCVQAYAQELQTPFERSTGNTSATYEEVISYYKSLAKKYKEISIEEIGITDIGKPLHLISISDRSSKNEKINVLINSGIHPGEPEGIDACMMIARDIVSITDPGKKLNRSLLRHINLYIIAVYNVDGALNRNSTTRTNQNGPEAYGFRANARNLDLNRDFIKMDSRNAFAFASIFHQTRPHLFIDTHTSNGADYQHVLTYIVTQKDKLNPAISTYMRTVFEPALNKQLKEKNYPPVPYVNAWSSIPDSGWAAFYESPRYATGYSTLFNTIGFTVETHMLKPFAQRLDATMEFIVASLVIADRDHRRIIEAKERADTYLKEQIWFPLNWKLDSSSFRSIDYLGYQSGYKPSGISRSNRLYYDRTRPTQLKVKFYDTYKATDSVRRPKAYIIPFAWKEVADRLIANGVLLTPVKEDQQMEAEIYYIEDTRTLSKPYEGHYLHWGTKIRSEKQKIYVRKGDHIAYTDQPAVRLLVETLEPQAVDSYFNWNFFDAILGQKEHFSDYVFEDLAVEIIHKDAVLKKRLEDKKNSDTSFAANPEAQLEFIYRNSVYAEKSFMRYPVYRLN